MSETSPGCTRGACKSCICGRSPGHDKSSSGTAYASAAGCGYTVASMFVSELEVCRATCRAAEALLM